MTNLIYINGIPHWEQDGVTLPIIAGGDATSVGTHRAPLSFQHHQSLHNTTQQSPTTPLYTQDQVDALIAAEFADSGAAAGPRPPTFGETRAGFQFQATESRISREFQAGQDRAAAIASEKHDKILLDLRNKMDEARDRANNAFAKGERIAGQKFQMEYLGLQQKFQKAEAEKDRTFQKEMKVEDLKAERQRIFVDMMGKDPVRATLFALGIGGSILPGGERFDDLPALKGAVQQEFKTESALNKLLQGSREGRIDLGSSGVTGLPPAIKSARAFQDAGAAGKSVLSSAFGVGDIRRGKQPGINPEEFLQLIDSVTPKGVLQ